MGFKADTSGAQVALEVRAQQMIAHAAQRSAEYMYEEFQKAIDLFYSSYTPKAYTRHYNMDMPGEVYTRTYNGHTKYFGGVKLNSGNIPHVYHDDPSYVFWESTMQGWHGGVGIFTTPSPTQSLLSALYVAAAFPEMFLR